MKRVHRATIWLAAIGTMLSAYFILAANAWMQNPVGYTFNATTNRAELTDFGAVLTNKLAVITFTHTIVAAFLTAGAFMAGVALWRLARRPDEDADAFRTVGRLGAVTVLIAALLVVVTGDQQARVMTSVQPMKMAAAEALYETSQPASFSLFTVGTLDGSKELFSIVRSFSTPRSTSTDQHTSIHCTAMNKTHKGMVRCTALPAKAGP